LPLLTGILIESVSEVSDLVALTENAAAQSPEAGERLLRERIGRSEKLSEFGNRAHELN
jgi:hypothetical protein